jgi:hypothetical protein
MDLRKLVRRWAGAGLLAGLFLHGASALHAGEGVLLPPLGSVPTPTRKLESLPPQVPPPVQAMPAPPPGAPPVMPPAMSPPPPMVPPAVPPDALPPALPSASPAAAAPAPPAAGCPTCGDCDGGDRFKDVPPVAVLPRAGWFPIPPSGPGYYTLCNQLAGNYLQGPPKYPYSRTSIQPNSFFDVDWRYLDDPKNTEHDFFDCLKRIRFGPDDLFMFSTGGEFRARYEYQGNSKLSNPNRGRIDTDDLFRERVYGDLYITEYFRIFAEFLSATSPNRLLPPGPSDRDPADFLNLFVDVRTLNLGDNPVWVRVGRQELLYGSQRLISTLDWANTRRTFEGVKAFWHSKEIDVDAFVVNPVVPTGTSTGGNKNGFTGPDTQQTFAGLWGTYKFKPGTCIDLYYLMLENDRPVYRAPTGAPGTLLFNTIGSRFVGDSNNWLWDVEGMSQFGQFAAQHQLAWSATAAGGYYFKDVPMTPTFWLYYDYASGSPNLSPNALPAGYAGPAGPHTFNQLFPFNHYYDWMDLVGRQNIHAFRSMTTFYPADWLFCQFQATSFFLDSATDFLYNSAGAGIRRDATGRSGRSVGTELDFITNIHIDNHQDILLSYSYLFAGRFVRSTATTPAGRENPQYVYVQYSIRW